MVGQVIIDLKNCCICIERLDKLVAIMTNWEEDLGFGCPNVLKFIKKDLNIEENMFLQNEKLIANFNFFGKYWSVVLKIVNFFQMQAKKRYLILFCFGYVFYKLLATTILALKVFQFATILWLPCSHTNANIEGGSYMYMCS